MMKSDVEPISVLPPLRGDWRAVTTPGNKIPSHGTDKWAMTYAYDFICVESDDKDKVRWHRKSAIKYLLGGVKLADTYGWGEPIYSPINGVVRSCVHSVRERNRLHILRDFSIAMWNDLFFSWSKGNIEQLGGNYLIIEGKEYSVFIAHAKMDSIKCQLGDRISAGEIIAQVGHSGNSTAPHLHFQLMDSPDIREANGLPCCFEGYEVLMGDEIKEVKKGIPDSQYTIRF